MLQLLQYWHILQKSQHQTWTNVLNLGKTWKNPDETQVKISAFGLSLDFQTPPNHPYQPQKAARICLKTPPALQNIHHGSGFNQNFPHVSHFDSTILHSFNIFSWWKFSKMPAGSGSLALLSSNGWGGLLAAGSMPSRWVTNRTCGWTQDFQMSDFSMEDFWQTKRLDTGGDMIGGGFQSLTHLQEHRKPPSVKVHVSDSNKKKAPPFLASENILRCKLFLWEVYGRFWEKVVVPCYLESSPPFPNPSDRNTATKWASKKIKLLWIDTRSLLASTATRRQVLKGPFFKGFRIHISISCVRWLFGTQNLSEKNLWK